MQTVSLNTNTPSSTTRPTESSKETVWNSRKVEPLSSDSSCLTQKGIRFSDRIAPSIASTTHPFKNAVVYVDWNAQEPEWRFADPAPYIPKNYEENLTVEELLERTGYKFATFDELQIDECKKVKDRVVGWWKSGVKWAKEHKKVLIIAGVVLGTGGLTAGAVLLLTSATAEAAVATGTAVGAAVAGGSGSKKKEEEDDKPQSPKEVVGASPPPPPCIPVIDIQPPANVKPPPPKETTSTPPPFIPPIHFQPPTHNTSHSDITSVPPIDIQPPTIPFLFQSQAKTYADYIIQKAVNPLTPMPSLPTQLTPVEKPEEHLYSSMFQTIQKGFSYIGANVIDNPDLFQPYSPHDSFQTAQAWTMPPLLSIAPLKSAYHNFLSLLASVDPWHLPPGEPTRSLDYTIAGIKPKGMQVSLINGMGNAYQDAYANAKYLQSFTSLQIDGIYNRSNGWLPDLLEIGLLNLTGYSPITEDLIMKKFTDFAEANKDDPHAKCLHPCHSQGAIHTRNVLEKLPQEVRDRVIIVNIAGACVIPRRLCFNSFNYVSERDIVPYLQHLHKGFTIANMSDKMQQEILHQDYLDAQEIIVLKPHEGATGLDHDFQSPTYADVLQKHLKEYETRNGQY